MYPNPIPLNNGAAEINYDYRGTSNEQSSYKNVSADLSEPQTLLIGHQTTKTGTVNQLRRSRFGLSRICEDAEGNQGAITVALVVGVPEKIATSAQVEEELQKMKDFLTNTGYIAKIIAADL